MLQALVVMLCPRDADVKALLDQDGNAARRLAAVEPPRQAEDRRVAPAGTVGDGAVDIIRREQIVLLQEEDDRSVQTALLPEKKSVQKNRLRRVETDHEVRREVGLDAFDKRRNSEQSDSDQEVPFTEETAFAPLEVMDKSDDESSLAQQVANPFDFDQRPSA